MSFYDNLEFVIVGTGRSGSGYVAQLLSALGIPTGHEGVFNPRPQRRDDLKGDCSWQALPYLQDFEGKVLLHTRHPAKFIRSMVTASPQFFLTEFHPYGRVRKQTSKWAMECLPPGVFQPTVEWAARYWLDYHAQAEPYSGYRFQIEAPDWKEITEILGRPRTQKEIDEAIEQVSKEYNKHTHDGLRIEREAVESLDIFSRLEAKAKEYGYEILESSAYAPDVGPRSSLSFPGQPSIQSGVVACPV